MDLGFLQDFFIPVIVGICLCVGFGLKKVKKLPNEWIPLILMGVGLGLNLWLQMRVDPYTILGGMFSGLASTGLHQMFKQIITRKEEKDHE